MNTKFGKWIPLDIEEGEEETNELFVYEWARTTATVLSISKILAGFTVKSECENYLYVAVWPDKNITKE